MCINTYKISYDSHCRVSLTHCFCCCHHLHFIWLKFLKPSITIEMYEPSVVSDYENEYSSAQHGQRLVSHIPHKMPL